MINLLSQEEKDNLRKEYHFRLATVSLAGVVFVVAASFVALYPSYSVLNSKYDLLVKDSGGERAKDQKTKEEDIENLVKDTNVKIEKWRDSAGTTHAWELSSHILNARTSGVYLTGLVYDNALQKSELIKGVAPSSSRFTLSGKASTRSSLLSFVEALKKKPFFSLVDLPISSLVNETNLDFTIRVYVDPNISIPEIK